MAIVKNDIVNGFNNTVANGAKGTVVWNSSNKPANAPAEHFSNSVPTMAVSNIGGTMIQASTTINAIRNAIYNLSKIRKYEYIVNNTGNRGSGVTTTVNQGNLADGYRQSAVNSNTNNFGIYSLRKKAHHEKQNYYRRDLHSTGPRLNVWRLAVHLYDVRQKN